MMRSAVICFVFASQSTSFSLGLAARGRDARRERAVEGDGRGPNAGIPDLGWWVVEDAARGRATRTAAVALDATSELIPCVRAWGSI